MPRAMPKTIADQFVALDLVSPEQAARASRAKAHKRWVARQQAQEEERVNREMDLISRYKGWYAVQLAARGTRPGIGYCARCGADLAGRPEEEIVRAPVGVVKAVALRFDGEMLPLRRCRRCPVEAR